MRTKTNFNPRNSGLSKLPGVDVRMAQLFNRHLKEKTTLTEHRTYISGSGWEATGTGTSTRSRLWGGVFAVFPQSLLQPTRMYIYFFVSSLIAHESRVPTTGSSPQIGVHCRSLHTLVKPQTSTKSYCSISMEGLRIVPDVLYKSTTPTVVG